jgi:DNA primase
VTRYTADSRDRVRDAVDMLAVVSEHTELRRAGATEYVGRCPFHDERTPSFGVNPIEKVYYCFGCQASGDVFTFVMETEGFDFSAALEALASRFGVELQTEQEDPQAAQRRQRRERLHSLLGRTATYYARYLWEAREAEAARQYLQARGLREDILHAFRVGYAPSAWDRILTASRRAGYSDEELITVGLAQRSQNRPGQIYDRFRQRIMFPATDARGNVVGFGARAMRENQRPKYLNTADGELYHKRRVLFGLDRARAAAAKAGSAILVEGYTDVLALHQAGLRNAVGIMGTALTEEQIAELERVAKVLVLCLDADAAGQEAMLRAAELTEKRTLDLQVVPLPQGADPAELIERDSDALLELVAAAVPFLKFHVERILERNDISTEEGRDRAFSEAIDALKNQREGAVKEDAVRRLAGALNLSEARLRQLIEEAAKRSVATAGAGATSRSGAGTPIDGAALDQAVRAERAFLALCIALPDAGARTLFQIDIDHLITSALLRRAARHIAGRIHSPLADLPAGDDQLALAVAGLVAEAGQRSQVSQDELEHARLMLDEARLERAIRGARERGGAEIPELAREREAVREARRAVTGRLERAM